MGSTCAYLGLVEELYWYTNCASHDGSLCLEGVCCGEEREISLWFESMTFNLKVPLYRADVYLY